MELMTVRPKPWYRQFWPWFLMSGPILALIGCMITIYLAYTYKVDVPLDTFATKHGLVINRPSVEVPVFHQDIKHTDAKH